MVYMTYPTEPSDIFTMFGSSIYSPNNVLFGGNRRVPAGLAQAPICCCQRVKSNLIKGFWVLHWGFPFKKPLLHCWVHPISPCQRESKFTLDSAPACYRVVPWAGKPRNFRYPAQGRCPLNLGVLVAFVTSVYGVSWMELYSLFIHANKIPGKTRALKKHIISFLASDFVTCYYPYACIFR